MIRLAISGSTVWSDPNQVSRLFTPWHDAVEIGYLSDVQALNAFVTTIQQQKRTFWGIHHPLYKQGSECQNDLLDKEARKRDRTWASIEQGLQVARHLGAHYLLVHLWLPTCDQSFREIRRVLSSTFGHHLPLTGLYLPHLVL